MPKRIVMLLFPRLTQLDLTGPFEIFFRLPSTTVDLVAASSAAVESEGGLRLIPNRTFADAPQCDLLFIPGGPGVDDFMLDQTVLDFVRKQAKGAQYIASVCTGALLLGAAGLLRGYNATTHWAAMDFLRLFDAQPTRQRVVRDRKIITGAGVSAGIDLALMISELIFGDEIAREIQTFIEYDPQPPFDAGTPERASASLLAAVAARNIGRSKAVLKAAANLSTGAVRT